MEGAVVFRNGRIFDGAQLREGHAARFEAGRLVALHPDDGRHGRAEVVDLGGDILSPGYVDLQVNGGGGIMFNDAPSLETLRRIAAAHRRLGAACILPTLITDTAAQTRAAIAAVQEAVAAGVPGIAGLHLEGPHLAVARKGAHDGALIRPMTPADLDTLLAAAEALPALMVTVAPESVTADQVAQLAAAGGAVSLGHTDADFDTCRRYVDAGARCVTHLFNAMSQLGSRAPGLVGAALAEGGVSAGLIADGIHVHPANVGMAFAAKAGPGEVFLVSDAMAPAGTGETAFMLGGRRVMRADGRLTLPDGTLAGADLDLTLAVRVAVERAGVDLVRALRAVTTVPAAVIGLPSGARLARLSDTVRISADLRGVQPAAQGLPLADHSGA